MAMALKTQNFLLLIFSIVVGAISGELLDLAAHLERVSNVLKSKVKSSNEKFAEGLITAFLLFCMGSMTVLGAIEEGLGNPPNLFLAKSLLDGVSAIALSTTFGVSIMFAAIPLLIYQGGLTLCAGLLQHVLTPPLVTELSAVGGVMLLGLGLNILEIKAINVLNMLPALPIAVILALFFAR